MFDGQKNPGRVYECTSACKKDPTIIEELQADMQRTHQSPTGEGNSLHQQQCVISSEGKRDCDPRGSIINDESEGNFNTTKALQGKDDRGSGINGGTLADEEKDASTAPTRENNCNNNSALDPENNCQPKKEQADNDNNNSTDKVGECSAAAEKVQQDCDSTQQTWYTQMNQAAQQIGGALAPDQTMCGTLTAVNLATQGSVTYFAATCNSSYSDCMDKCKMPAEYSKVTNSTDPNYANKIEMQNHLKKCNDMGVKGKQAEQAMAQAVQKLVGAVQQCNANYGSLCSNPAYKNTSACQGIQAASTLPVTGSGIATATDTSVNHQGVGSESSGGSSTSNSKGFNLSSLADGEDKTVNPHKSGPGEEIGGAKGGGSVSASGGGGGGPVATGGGKGGLSGLVSSVLSGFFGGGGGGSGSSSGGGWKNLFGKGGSGGGSYGQNQAKGPDLRQFMPGGIKDPNRNRGIAGKFVGNDGISGPHANIWALVNNRYQYKRVTLLP